jgi:hypothetical protein
LVICTTEKLLQGDYNLENDTKLLILLTGSYSIWEFWYQCKKKKYDPFINILDFFWRTTGLKSFPCSSETYHFIFER